MFKVPPPLSETCDYRVGKEAHVNNKGFLDDHIR